MKLKVLSLKNFCRHVDSVFEFKDFACLIGDNGVGKTTVLNAISLLTSSLDFRGGLEMAADLSEGLGMITSITPEQRLRAYLHPNVRHVGQVSGATGFVVSGVFEHEGKDHEVVLTEKGFLKNEIVDKPWWWAGISYFAKFDSDMVNFQLKESAWPKFAKAYSGITGYELEPDVYGDPDLGPDNIVVGFWMKKDGGKVYSRRASAGEKKLAKSLSQPINMPVERQPHIVMVDNMEMHVHKNRHLRMFAEVQELFSGMQVVATTHSETVIREYQPREHIYDLDRLTRREDGKAQA